MPPAVPSVSTPTSVTTRYSKGTGTYNDNGTYVKVGPGDTAICNDGELHGLVNDGDEPLEYIALILYS